MPQFLILLAAGGTASTVFNAANEVAVSAFLARDLPFNRITDVIEVALARVPAGAVRSLDDVLNADRAARTAAREALGRTLSPTQ